MPYPRLGPPIIGKRYPLHVSRIRSYHNYCVCRVCEHIPQPGNASENPASHDRIVRPSFFFLFNLASGITYTEGVGGREGPELSLVLIIFYFPSLPFSPPPFSSCLCTTDYNVDTSFARRSAEDSKRCEGFPGGEAAGESCD